MHRLLSTILLVLAIACAGCSGPVDCEQLKREGRAAMQAAPTVEGKVQALKEAGEKAKAAGCMK